MHFGVRDPGRYDNLDYDNDNDNAPERRRAAADCLEIS